MHFLPLPCIPIAGLVCMTQDPRGSLKDTSIADGGKIGSALTLGVNCSRGEGGRGPCCNRAREEESEKRGGKGGKEKWKGGWTPNGGAYPD